MNIQELVNQPSESLAVELKNWIDPDSPAGITTLVKAAIAMRNNNAGYILIGFDNDTCQPDYENVPENVQELFHKDKIQGMVTKYASESFEVEIHFPEIDGNTFPVIEIGPGVRTPVGTKRDYVVNSATHIGQNKVYVRSLSSNNTPSTTEATWKDWDPLVERCFDNREADIGRFLRRHIGALNPEHLRALATSITEGMQPVESLQESSRRYLQEGSERFHDIVTDRGLELPEHGTWEVATVIDGEVPVRNANRDFLCLLDSSNPRYTGWPVWRDSRASTDENARPYVLEGTWEAVMISLDSFFGHVDFWRLDPAGKFYLLRALEDDISGSDRAPDPLSVIDFGLPIIRTAEAIAVGASFARAMGCDPEQTRLVFCFKWTRLRGRQLSSWAQPRRYISSGSNAYQDEVVSEVTVPLDTPNSALAQFVDLATKPLFEVFDGFALSSEVVEDLTQRLIERRL